MAAHDAVLRPELAICLPAIGATTPVILNRVDHVLRSSAFDGQRDTVQIAMAEVLNNVIEHGYQAKSIGAVSVTLRMRGPNLNIHIVDWGAPYPNLTLPNGAAPDPMEMAEGGYGWFLIRTLIPKLRYVWRRGANHLCLQLTADSEGSHL